MSENNLTGQIGELRMTIEIKRAATGETEIHELIGTAIGEGSCGPEGSSPTFTSATAKSGTAEAPSPMMEPFPAQPDIPRPVRRRLSAPRNQSSHNE